jgi:hypothetical protein
MTLEGVIGSFLRLAIGTIETALGAEEILLGQM